MYAEIITWACPAKWRVGLYATIFLPKGGKKDFRCNPSRIGSFIIHFGITIGKHDEENIAAKSIVLLSWQMLKTPSKILLHLSQRPVPETLLGIEK